jgi:heat shock protein 5
LPLPDRRPSPDFNAAQRQATEDAASAAGLQVLNILNDSVAAILAYDLPIECSKPYALVCDFGSSAFTATVSRLEEDGDITLLNMQTDTKWASQKIDDVIVRFLADAYGKRTEKSVSENARAMAKLKLEAEKAKIHLDTHTKAHIVIENFTRDGEDLAETLTRSKYDQISGDIVWRTLFLSELALMEANFSSTKQKMLDDVEVQWALSLALLIVN